MEDDGLLLCLQEANTGHLTEADESNPYPKIAFLKSKNILLPALMHCTWSLPFRNSNWILPYKSHLVIACTIPSPSICLSDFINPTIFIEGRMFIQLQFVNGRWTYS
jgi:hypothetical protein